jgi:hypothetical protein
MRSVGLGSIGDEAWIATKDSSLIFVRDLLKLTPVDDHDDDVYCSFAVFPNPSDHVGFEIRMDDNSGVDVRNLTLIRKVDGVPVDLHDKVTSLSNGRYLIRTDELTIGAYLLRLETSRGHTYHSVIVGK